MVCIINAVAIILTIAVVTMNICVIAVDYHHYCYSNYYELHCCYHCHVYYQCCSCYYPFLLLLVLRI